MRNTSTVAAAGLTAIRTPSEDAFAAHLPPGAPSQLTWAADTAAADSGCGSSGKFGSNGGSSVSKFGSSGLSASKLTKSTSQRARWAQEPYLTDRLKAGAAAVKVGAVCN